MGQMSTNDLEVFQDLSISGTGKPIEMIRKALLRTVASPWHHAPENELRMKSLAPRGEDVIAFTRDASDDAPTIALVLFQKGDHYEVTNIVPKESGSISISQYNAILQDFIEKIALPATSDGEIETGISKPRENLNDWMDEAAARALRAFSAAANKSTGASHPLDERRWFKFLVATHQSGRVVDAELLGRWLIEVDHWPVDEAHELAGKYETALSLLRFYDDNK